MISFLSQKKIVVSNRASVAVKLIKVNCQIRVRRSYSMV